MPLEVSGDGDWTPLLASVEATANHYPAHTTAQQDEPQYDKLSRDTPEREQVEGPLAVVRGSWLL